MRILFINHAPHTVAKRYDVESIEALLNSYASASTRIEVGFPDNYEGAQVSQAVAGQSRLNGLHHMMETPGIVRKILWAAQNGYDAVISSNTFDPGVDGGRLAVDIPVIGLLRTSLHAALTLADRVGITVPLASHIPYTWRILRSYGLDRFVTDIRPIGVYGKDVKSRHDELFAEASRLIRGLVDETGAEIVLPLGGALIPYVVDPARLADATGVQVLNTKAIGIRFAEACVTLGMTQSAATYPRATLDISDSGRGRAGPVNSLGNSGPQSFDDCSRPESPASRIAPWRQAL